MSVLRTGRGRAGGGGEEVEFLTEKKIPLRNVPGVLKRPKIKIKYFFWGGGRKISEFFFPTKIFVFKNVPGVLERMQTKNYFSGGGGF